MRVVGAILLLAVAVSAQITNGSSSQGTYLFTFPEKIAQGWIIPIRVEILDAPSTVRIVIQLVNNTKPGTVFREVVEFFEPGVPRTIDFQIPENLQRPWGWNNLLNMTFEGSGGLQFTANHTVDFSDKSMSIFVQTDKAKYKPGQSVLIRAVATGPDLKVIDRPMDIIIYDANTNRVKQWLNSQGANGVVTKNFTTSYELVLGDWKVEVSVGDDKKEMTFTVEEYVLPKFEVAIIPPSYVLANDSDFRLKVTATYTQGRGVFGQARLRFSNKYFYPYKDMAEPLFFKDVSINNGEGSVTVQMNELREIAYLMQSRYSWNVNLTRAEVQIRYRQFEVQANMTEGITGITLSADPITIKPRNIAYKLRFMDVCPSVFKPGLKYRCMVRASMIDDTLIPSSNLTRVNITVNYEKPLPSTPSPPTTTTTTTAVPDKNATVSLRRIAPDYIYPWYQTTEQVQLSSEMRDIDPLTGFVAVEFDVPSEATRISYQARAYGAQAYKSASKSYSPSDSFIQLAVADNNAKVGQLKEFTLRATTPVDKITYQVVSRGRVVGADDVNFGVMATNQKFSISMTGEMSPNPTVIVYLRRADGEIVADTISIKVDGTFDTNLKVSFNATVVKPGDPVKLRVTGESNSLVFLLARDLSVLLLKDGNDIDQRTVSQELMSYDYGSYFPWFDMFYSSWWWPRGSSARDAYSVFSGANVAIVTDANLYRHKQDFDYGGPIYMARAPMGGGSGGMLEDSVASNSEGQGDTAEVESNDRVRKLFPETWLWQSVSVGPSGVYEEDQVAPDTITSWITSAFSVSSQSGLTVTTETANLTTELKLFMRMELPYSVIRGEQFSLQVTVFNYYELDVPVLVTLVRNNQFENIFVMEDQTTGTLKKVMDSSQTSKYAYVPANGATAVYFAIHPKVAADIMLEARMFAYTAHLPVQQHPYTRVDSVQRLLKVEPEGKERTESIPLLIDLRNTASERQFVDLSFPPDIVEGSEKLSVSVAGDLLGPSLENIQNLVRMPYGCGEQNMINFAPNIYVMNYLKATSRLTPELKSKIENYMEKGYQRQLKYKHRQGGYSAFGERSYGNSNRKASTWLTAFVLKCFTQAYPLIPDVIDTKVVYQGLWWMINQQNSNGSFTEDGRVFNSRLKGGSGQGIALTAYVLIAMKEALDSGIDLTGEVELNEMYPENITKVQIELGDSSMPLPPGEMPPPPPGSSVTSSEYALRAAVDKARAYLENTWNTLTTSYDKIIVTYALSMTQSPQATVAQAEMERIAVRDQGTLYWSDPAPAQKPRWYSWYRKTDAKNIEMTAYALLVYGLTGDVQSGVLATRWISSQRNDVGGFISTQDTVIALQALSGFASAIYSPISAMDINVQAPSFSKTYSINSQNSLLLQIDALSTDVLPAQLTVDAQGTGFAVVEVHKQYNVLSDANSDVFRLTARVLDLDKNSFMLTVCFNHLRPGPSGMSLLNITLLTGYVPNILGDARTTAVISRTETNGKVFTLYLDEVLNKEQCVSIRMQMVDPVFDSQKAAIVILDYYEPDNQEAVFYYIGPKDICSVCRGCNFLCQNPTSPVL